MRFLKRLAPAIGLLGVIATAQAQDIPSRPITLIVPFAAGGSTDVIARVVAEAMRGVLGQSIVIDNRGGAGGSLGTAAIAKAEPDGTHHRHGHGLDACDQSGGLQEPVL